MTRKPGSKSEQLLTAIETQPAKVMSQTAMLFFHNHQLSIEISAQGNRRILRGQNTAIAQLDQTQPDQLLQVDHANSILGIPPDFMAYSPYGHLNRNDFKELLAFNGQRYDPIAQGYLLGNGYRLFSPRLMRFCSQDSLSPFERGGLNAYAYCKSDPVNNVDPTGHSLIPSFLRKSPQQLVKYRTKKLDKLNSTRDKIKQSIEKLEDKRAILKQRVSKWTLEVLAGNNADRHGNTATDYRNEAVDKLNANTSERRKLNNQLHATDTKIQATQDKLEDAKKLAASKTTKASDSSNIFETTDNATRARQNLP